jgi:ABC-type glycerol-3-phosphate transport system substrate-binding protein
MTSFPKHRWLLVYLGLLAVLFFGCSPVAPPPEPVTLTFMHPQDPTGSYEQWAEQFHDQYPYITVELEAISGANASRIASKDAFVVTQFELGPHLQNRAVIDLSTFIEQDDELNAGDFYAPALEVFNDQGRQWALPFGVDMIMLYYNKDVFDRYMVSYPQIGLSWSDFLDLALQTTDPGADLYGYALHHSGDMAIFEPVMMIYQYGGRIFDSLQAPTMVTLDDPLNIDAMSFYASLMYNHGVAPMPEDLGRMPSPYPWRGVMEGRFAMWTTMFSERGGPRWPAPWSMNWGVVPMPRGQAVATLATAEGLFISSQCEHPDAAWLWIKYVSQQMSPYMVPARQSLARSDEFSARAGGDVAAAAQAAMESAMLVNPELLGFEAELGVMVEAFNQIRSGNVTPEIALPAAQERAGH